MDSATTTKVRWISYMAKCSVRLYWIEVIGMSNLSIHDEWQAACEKKSQTNLANSIRG